MKAADVAPAADSSISEINNQQSAINNRQSAIGNRQSHSAGFDGMSKGQGLACRVLSASLGFRGASEPSIFSRMQQEQMLMPRAAEAPAKAACGIRALFAPKNCLVTMTDSTEQVYTMTDYYDGPRCGMADYLGRPHLYRSLWADIDHERDDVFELFPVDEETFTLAVEDWNIWRRWRAAFDRGEVTIDSHPALPADRQRHNEIEMILKPRLAVFAESEGV